MSSETCPLTTQWTATPIQRRYARQVVRLIADVRRQRIRVMRRFSFDASLTRESKLRFAKITESDLSLIRQFGIKDWNGREFDKDLLLKYGTWVVNEDKSVIFKALGGGSCEIPEMYDLICREAKIRLECGGGGSRARRIVKNDDQIYDTTVFVTRIQIPPHLAHERDSLLALVSEALLVESRTSGRLTVEFNLREGT
jgi:hypothetical protein